MTAHRDSSRVVPLRSRRVRFGSFVLACTLFAVLAVGITGGLLLDGFRSTLTQAIADREARIVEGRAHLLAEEISRVEVGLAELAKARDVDLADDDIGAEKRAIALAASETAPFPVTAALLDASGAVLWSEPGPVSLQGDGPALARRAIAEDRATVSVAREEIRVAVGVSRRGAMVGIVRVSGAELLGARLAGALGAGGHIALLRRAGGREEVVAERGREVPAELGSGGVGQRWSEDRAGRRWLVTELEVIAGPAPLVLRLVQAAPELERESFGPFRRLAVTLAVGLLLAALGGALLAAMVGRLEEARLEVEKARELAAMGKTALAVAHEVKNSINGLSIAIDLLASRRTSPDTADVVHAQARQEIVRLRDVAEDLKLFSSPPELHRRPADVNAICRTALAQAAPLAADCGAQMELAVGDGPLWVHADELKLLGAVENLVRNGLEAMGPGAYDEPLGSTPEPRERRLLLSSRTEGQDAVVEIADTGCGLGDEVRERLFEPFVTTKRTGTGLGLAIVRRVVEAHGGDVAAAPREGGGTIFRVRLPALPRDAGAA